MLPLNDIRSNVCHTRVSAQWPKAPDGFLRIVLLDCLDEGFPGLPGENGARTVPLAQGTRSLPLVRTVRERMNGRVGAPGREQGDRCPGSERSPAADSPSVRIKC